jgi:ribonucleoside-diphosphate reductase alpha chain
MTDSKLPINEATAEEQWEEFVSELVITRYAMRDPATGSAVEVSFGEVKERVANKFKDPGVRAAILEEKIITATPFLMNGGNTFGSRLGYYSCYPLGKIRDSTKAIFAMEKDLVDIFQHAGGGGIDVSDLRPAGSLVDNGQGTASGPVSFAKGFSHLSERISQGGKRRGALMIQLNWDHADRDEFISFKGNSPGVYSGCNVSLNVTSDDFWEDEQLINKIADNIWKSGDPGLLFTKKSLANTPVPAKHEPIYSNPCGEYLSAKDTACNLLTVNLSKCLATNMNDFLENVTDAAEKACLAGNEILDMEEGFPPVKRIAERTSQFRPVGIGMTGLHHAMNHFEVSYADELQAPKFAKLVQFCLMIGSMRGSMTYGLVNGLAIREWDYGYINKLGRRVNDMMLSDEYRHSAQITAKAEEVMTFLEENAGLFNSVTTSQAPTGSISQMLKVACTGIEPYFDIVQKRRFVDTTTSGGELKWREVTLVPLEFFGYDDDKLAWIAEQTAHKIDPMQQIRILEAIQEFCHTAASKTINLPEETTQSDIKKILMYAKDSNLKGITMFRDSSMDGVLSGSRKATKFGDTYRRRGETIKFKGKDDSLYIVGNKGGAGHIREVFINTNFAGSEDHALCNALGRVISISLQHDHTLLDPIVKTLQGIAADGFWTCPGIDGDKGAMTSSIPSALAKALICMHDSEDFELTSTYDICPACKERSFKRSGSCSTCVSCGHNSC